MNNEVRIKVTGENDAGPAFKGVIQDADHASRKLAEMAEKADQVDTFGSKATSSLGALGSGLELIGKTDAQAALNKVALATDFVSGAGEAAFLVFDTWKSKLGGFNGVMAKVKEGLNDVHSTAGKVTTGVMAAGAALVALAAVGAVLNTTLKEKVNVSMHDTVTGLQDIAANGKITDDTLRGFSSNTQLLHHDLSSLNGGFGQWIKNLGDSDLGLSSLTGTNKVFAESSDNTAKRLKAIDDGLVQLVQGGHADQAKDAFDALATEARRSGVSVDELKAGLPGYTEAQKNATGATKEAVTALADQGTELQRVSNSLKAQTDPLFAVYDAQEQVNKAQIAYDAAVRKSGRGSQEAATASRALDKATIGLVGSLSAASGGSAHLTAQQQALLRAAGISTTRIKQLDTSLYNAWKQAQKLDNFNIDVTVAQHFKMFGKPYSTLDPYHIGGLAHGGVRGAAGGGPRGGATLVGENGPELVDLPPGSAVHTAGDSARMMGGMGGGSGPIVIQINLDGKQVAEAIVEPLRGQIWSRAGGDAQRYLGRGQ